MRQRRRLAFFALPASVVLALLAGWLVIDRADGPTAATPEPSVTSEASRAPKVQWVDVHGVALPVSPTDGPARVDDARSSGFAQTEAGAAIAAAHLLTRVSPSAGPAAFEPALAEQVVGPNRDALRQAVSEQYQAMSARGAPIGALESELVGFQLEDGPHLPSDTATVRIVLTSPELRASGRMLEALVAMQWSDGDWRLVAPPHGDWSITTRVVTTTPPAMVTFDEVG